MKKQLLKIFILVTLLAAFTGKAFAAVYDWTNAHGIATGNGAFNYQWRDPANWTIGGVVATTYPGQTGNTDVVQIGVGIYTPGTLYVIVAAGTPLTVASITIGDNSNTNGVQNVFYIDIRNVLTVTGTFLQKHSDNLGLPGNGSVTYPLGYNFHIEAWLWGIGTLNVNKIQIGDSTKPTPDNAVNVTRFKMATPDGSPNLGLHINVTTDFVLHSKTKNDSTSGTNKIISVSSANFSLVSGYLTVGNQIILENEGAVVYDGTTTVGRTFQPQARFAIEVTNNKGNVNGGENKYLYLKGANALSIPGGYSSSGQLASNYFQFWYLNPSSLAADITNLGQSFVTYSGDVDQKVYTNSSFLTTGFFSDAAGNYQNLVFSGAGKKTIDATTNPTTYPLKITGNLSITGATPVDLSANNPTIVFNNGSNFTTPVSAAAGTNYTIPGPSNFSSVTGSSFTNGSIALTIPGTTANGGAFNTSSSLVTLAGAVTNSGTFNQTGGTVNLNNTYTNTGTFKATAGNTYLNQAGAQSLTDNSAAGKGSTFYNLFVQNGGTKTLSGSGAGQFYIASNGFLNMVSTTDLAANGFLTLNSDVTGSATVPTIPSDCNITGNVTVQRYVSANRAYRLVSSPVFTGNDGTNNIYGVNYLMTNTYLTGTDGVGGGFSKAGNPTLYLYRENLAPQYTTFLNSNFRGIKNIASTPYLMDDADYPTANIPVANGYLFYYRGSSKQASLATLTTAGAASTTDTLNAVGQLNRGTITVHNWYDPTNATLGYTNVSGDPTVTGFNLVGNPYASSIDFEALTSSGLSPFAYYLIPTGLQGSGNYGIYDASLHAGSNGATKVIPSGMGFFVIATGTGSSLTFTEAAKVNTQVTGPNLFMGKPLAENNTIQYLHLQMALDTVSTDETIIGFNDNAKSAYDMKEDAQYKTGTGKVSLSSLSGDNKSLAINKLPLSNGVIIPLKVSATADGTYKFNTKAIKGIPQLYDVWLMDAFKKDSVNLRKTATYSFTVAKADTNTFGSNRFKLVMRQDPAQMPQLTSFNASKVGNKPQVEVVWTSLNEQNYTHYTVERSTNNGATFEVVGGLTSSGQGAYSLVDKNAVNGTNQYRLKQEDLNNKITYSNVVTIQYSDKSNNLTGGGHLSVYPNPAVSNINLTIDPKKQVAAYSIKITNSVGMIVKQAVTTQPNWQDNVSNLLTGTYLIQVVNNKDNSLVGQTKFVKL